MFKRAAFGASIAAVAAAATTAVVLGVVDELIRVTTGVLEAPR
jgi:predicted porin